MPVVLPSFVPLFLSSQQTSDVPRQVKQRSNYNIIMLSGLQEFVGKLVAPRPAASGAMPKTRRTNIGLELLYYGIVLVSSAALSKFIIGQLDPFGQRKARQKVCGMHACGETAQRQKQYMSRMHPSQALLRKKELHRRLGRWVDTEGYEDVCVLSRGPIRCCWHHGVCFVV